MRVLVKIYFIFISTKNSSFVCSIRKCEMNESHKSESHLVDFGDAFHGYMYLYSVHIKWAKIMYMLDCYIQSKSNGCDRYFPFNFGTHDLQHTIFGSYSVCAPALCHESTGGCSIPPEMEQQLKRGNELSIFPRLNWEEKSPQIATFPVKFSPLIHGIVHIAGALNAFHLSVASHEAHNIIWHFLVEPVL